MLDDDQEEQDRYSIIIDYLKENNTILKENQQLMRKSLQCLTEQIALLVSIDSKLVQALLNNNKVK